MTLIILLTVAFGCYSGLLIRRWMSSKRMSTFVGATITSVLSFEGVYVLVWPPTPSELGVVLVFPILIALLILLTVSIVVRWISKGRALDTNNSLDKLDAGSA